MIVRPARRRWQTVIFKFTLIPQAPEALTLPSTTRSGWSRGGSSDNDF